MFWIKVTEDDTNKTVDLNCDAIKHIYANDTDETKVVSMDGASYTYSGSKSELKSEIYRLAVYYKGKI